MYFPFCCHVIQVLVLDRLVSGDLVTARFLLTAMKASKHLGVSQALPEYAPFAYSLAGVLQDLVKAKQLSSLSSFWFVAVEDVLIPLVDADGQVSLLMRTRRVVKCCATKFICSPC